jgi:hypothetical protein
MDCSGVAPAPPSVEHGRARVVGEVTDEAGAPIAGALVELSSEQSEPTSVRTDEGGRFEVLIAPAPSLRIAASHPDFGLQATDYQWRGWSQYDRLPTGPVHLVLRRGVVLTGVLRDEAGQPWAHQTLLLVPAYIGSGPWTHSTTTDAAGRFELPRAVLDQFELVPRSLDDWHPRDPGEHVRITGASAEWLARARLGQPIELTVTRFTLIPLTVQLTDATGALARDRSVQLWLRNRRAPEDYRGSLPRSDAQGRVVEVVERGVEHELWVSEPDQRGLVAPWTASAPPLWQGALEGATTIALSIPAR